MSRTFSDLWRSVKKQQVENGLLLGRVADEELIPKGEVASVLGETDEVMATRGQMKSIEFKQAGLASTANIVAEASASPALLPAASSTAAVKGAGAGPPVLAASTRSATHGGASQRSHSAPSPIAIAAGKNAPIVPRFTAEETILLRGLASGSTSKEMAAQMRLPRESLYRLISDLRRKTGASSDASLAVWVLRNMGSSAGERRGGGR